MSILSKLVEGIKKNTSSVGNGSDGYEKEAQVNTLEYNGPLKASPVQIDSQTEYDGSGVLASRDANTEQTLIDVPAWGYKDFIN